MASDEGEKDGRTLAYCILTGPERSGLSRGGRHIVFAVCSFLPSFLSARPARVKMKRIPPTRHIFVGRVIVE